MYFNGECRNSNSDICDYYKTISPNEKMSEISYFAYLSTMISYQIFSSLSSVTPDNILSILPTLNIYSEEYKIIYTGENTLELVVKLYKTIDGKQFSTVNDIKKIIYNYQWYPVTNISSAMNENYVCDWNEYNNKYKKESEAIVIISIFETIPVLIMDSLFTISHLMCVSFYDNKYRYKLIEYKLSNDNDELDNEVKEIIEKYNPIAFLAGDNYEKMKRLVKIANEKQIITFDLSLNDKDDCFPYLFYTNFNLVQLYVPVVYYSLDSNITNVYIVTDIDDENEDEMYLFMKKTITKLDERSIKITRSSINTKSINDIINDVKSKYPNGNCGILINLDDDSKIIEFATEYKRRSSDFPFPDYTPSLMKFKSLKTIHNPLLENFMFISDHIKESNSGFVNRILHSVSKFEDIYSDYNYLLYPLFYARSMLTLAINLNSNCIKEKSCDINMRKVELDVGLNNPLSFSISNQISHYVTIMIMYKSVDDEIGYFLTSNLNFPLPSIMAVEEEGKVCDCSRYDSVMSSSTSAVLYHNNTNDYISSRIKVSIGIIFLKYEKYKYEAGMISRVLYALATYFNNIKDTKFQYEAIVKYIDDESEIKEVFEVFHKVYKIKHIFGVSAGVMVDSIVEKLDEYDMQLWYIGYYYTLEKCSPRVFSYCPNDILISTVYDLVYSTNKKLVFLYCDVPNKEKIIDNLKKPISYSENALFIDVEGNVTNTVDNVIKEIYSFMPNGGNIIVFNSYNIAEKVNQIMNSFYSMSFGSNYEFYAIMGFYNDKVISSRSYNIKYFTMFDYLYSSERSRLFSDIYKVIYRENRIASMWELLAANALFNFHDQITAHSPDDLYTLQRTMLTTEFDTVSGMGRIKSNFYEYLPLVLIDVYPSNQIKYLSTTKTTGVLYINSNMMENYCNFTEESYPSRLPIELFTLGLIYDESFGIDRDIIKNSLENGIDNINNKYGGILGVTVSYKTLIYTSDMNRTEFINKFKELIDLGIKMFIGYMNGNLIEIIANEIKDDSSLLLIVASDTYISKCENNNVLFYGGSIYEVMNPGISYMINNCENVLILYSASERYKILLNIYENVFIENGITISYKQGVSDNSNGYTNMLILLNQYLTQNSCIVTLLSPKLLISLLDELYSFFLTGNSNKIININSDPGLIISSLKQTPSIDTYFFTIFNPSESEEEEEEEDTDIKSEILSKYYEKYGKNITLSRLTFNLYTIPLFLRDSSELIHSKEVSELFPIFSKIPILSPAGVVHIGKNHYFQGYFYLIKLIDDDDNDDNIKLKFITEFKSSNPILTEPFPPYSGKRCSVSEIQPIIMENERKNFTRNNVEEDSSLPKIKIAMIYSVSNSDEYYDIPNFLSVIAGYNYLKNENDNYDISYKLFNIDSSPVTKCESIINEVINEGFKLVISGNSKECMNIIIDKIKDDHKDILYFITTPTSGEICIKNVIVTSGVPSQYYFNSVYYFALNGYLTSLSYIFYNSNDPSSIDVKKIIEKLLKDKPTDESRSMCIDVSNSREMNESMNIMMNEVGVVFLATDLGDSQRVLYEMYIRNIDRDKYQILGLLLTEKNVKTMPFYLKDRINIFGGYFNRNNEEGEMNKIFLKYLYEYSMISEPLNQMSNVFMVFLLLNKLIKTMNHSNIVLNSDNEVSEFDISRIYNSEFESHEGITQLASNNNLFKYYQLVRIYANDTTVVLKRHYFTEYPYSYSWELNEGKICDFEKAEPIYDVPVIQIENVMMLKNNTDNEIFGIFHAVKERFNILGKTTNNYFKIRSNILRDESECDNFESIISKFKYDSTVYLYLPSECLKKFIVLIKDKKLKVSIINEVNETYCYENVYYGSFIPNSNAAVILETFYNVFRYFVLVLIHDDDNVKLHQYFEKNANYLLIPEVYSMSFDDIRNNENSLDKILEKSLDYKVTIIVDSSEMEDIDYVLNHINNSIISSSIDINNIYYMTYFPESKSIKYKHIPHFWSLNGKFKNHNIDNNNEYDNYISKTLYDFDYSSLLLNDEVSRDVISELNILYFWYEFRMKYDKITPNDENFRENVYNFKCYYYGDEEEDKNIVYMQRNNYLTKLITLSYYKYNGELVEYSYSPNAAVLLNNNNDYTFENINYNNSINNRLTVCMWEDDINVHSGKRVLNLYYVGLMLPLTIGDYYTNGIQRFILLVKLIDEYNNENSFNSNTYLMIKSYNMKRNDENEVQKYIDEMHNNKINLIFTSFGFFNISKLNLYDDTLYLLVGYDTQSVCRDNIIHITNSIPIIASLHEKSFLKDSNDVIVLYDDSPMSKILLSHLSDCFSSSSLHHEEYNIYDEIYKVKDKRVELYNSIYEYCKESKNKCYIIVSVYKNDVGKEFEYMYESKLLTEIEDIIIYNMFSLIEIPNYDSYRKYLCNVKTIVTYTPSLQNSSYSFLSNGTKVFQQFCENNFPYDKHYSSSTEDIFSAFKMLELVLNRFTNKNGNNNNVLLSNYNSSDYISQLVYHQYSNSGVTMYLGGDLYIQRYYFYTEYNCVYDNQTIIGATNQLAPRDYDKYVRKCSMIDVTVKIGILFDYSNEKQKKLSHILLVLIDSLIRDENKYNSSTSNINIAYKVFPYYNNEEKDKKVYDDLFDVNNEYKVLLSSNSMNIMRYILTKYKSQLNNKLIYSSAFIYTPVCEKNIFFVSPSLKSRIIPSLRFSERLGFKNVLLLLQDSKMVTGYLDALIEYMSETVKKYIGDSVIVKTFKIPSYSDNESSERNDLLNETVMFIKEYTKNSTILILNSLNSEELVLFEDMIYVNEISYIRALQIIYYVDEYELGIDKMTRLYGNIISRTYLNDDTNLNSINFQNYINDNIGSIDSISQSISDFESIYKIFISSYIQSKSLLLSDGYDVSDNRISIDYLRRASQLVSIETSSGIKEGTITNQFTQIIKLAEISMSGTPVLIDDVKFTVLKYPEVSYGNEECNVGPLRLRYELPRGSVIAIVTVMVIVSVAIYIVIGFIIKFRNFKVIRASSHTFVIYFLFSGTIALWSIIPLNVAEYSNTTCMIFQAIFYILLLNYACIIVLRTWRIHAVYNNRDMKRLRINNEKVFMRLYLYLLLFLLLSFIWGLISPYSEYEEKISSDEGNNLVTYYIPTCNRSIAYDAVYFVFLLYIFISGLYYSYTTRNCVDDYNDSNTLTACIGCLFVCFVLYFAIEMTLSNSPTAKFLLESIGIVLINIGISLIIVTPKFYRIIKDYSSMKPSSDSSNKDKNLKKDIYSSIHLANKVRPLSPPESRATTGRSNLTNPTTTTVTTTTTNVTNIAAIKNGTYMINNQMILVKQNNPVNNSLGIEYNVLSQSQPEMTNLNNNDQKEDDNRFRPPHNYSLNILPNHNVNHKQLELATTTNKDPMVSMSVERRNDNSVVLINAPGNDTDYIESDENL